MTQPIVQQSGWMISGTDSLSQTPQNRRQQYITYIDASYPDANTTGVLTVADSDGVIYKRHVVGSFSQDFRNAFGVGTVTVTMTPTGVFNIGGYG